MTAEGGEVRVSISHGGDVATLTVDREPKLNALTLPMLEELGNACSEVERSSARVVVVRTAGTRVFCVGADITNFAELNPLEMWADWIATGHRAFERLASLRQPTVAIVDGLALGGGLELALACDLRVVSSSARMGLPEAGLGTVPGWGGTGRLVDVVGRSRALELMLTGRQLSGNEALEWGLANRIATPEQLDTAGDQLIEEVLASAPIASQVIKQLVDAGAHGGSTRTLEALAAAFAANTGDLREGIAAFREKRSPIFTGN